MMISAARNKDGNDFINGVSNQKKISGLKYSAADESSMSGKAKKAKDWGIPVISVEKFITFCTFG